ncbi:MAG: EscU/YscU/HrcU family type III secretion system export apparatus switch protein [Spirochaetales bacterium]|nr:EscU/YscU/HrcU family type III secretion system export apparatus switch protein [Spirochaetales bacterium]
MKKAVAVKYLPDLPAPFIIAKGRGDLAEKIELIARQHDVGIVIDRTLVDRLIEIDVGDFIPEELYRIIAEILVFAMRLAT